MPLRPSEREQLETLFDLGRQVTGVLDLDELLARIPLLLSRLIRFHAFAVYLADHHRQELRIAYAVGYPEGAAERVRLRFGEGIVGAAMAEQRPILVNDLTGDTRYVAVAPDMEADLVVPLILKGRAFGALNIMSRTRDTFSPSDVPILAQFGAHVAVALENARLFELESQNAKVFATLAEIGREVASILDVDLLLEHVARLTRRVIDYRTFGILLLDEVRGELDMRIALQYGERVTLPRVRLGEGIVGYAAYHREAVLVNDVTRDPRYINVVADVKSELAIPLLLKDRCLGVIDLESPHLDAFTERDVDILTVLAGQTAVALENARLYEAVRANEDRLERELRFAQRVQVALLPSAPPRVRGTEVAARFAPARELGGDIHDFLSPETHTLVVAVGDVSGKGVPAALYGAAVGELIRSRTFRRRYTTVRTTPGQVLEAINTILNDRQLEEFFCTVAYASFDMKRRVLTLANSGLPYPVRASGDDVGLVRIAGVPLGAFPGISYEEHTLPLVAGDLFLFYTDGVYEALNTAGDEFGIDRLLDIVRAHRHDSTRALVDAVFEAVTAFRGEQPQNDDITAVALRVTN